MNIHAGLNLGCGQHANVASPNWLNVDRYDMPEWPLPPDVIANVLDGLPFPTGRFSYVYLGHFLEHLTYDDQLPKALAEIRRVCRREAVVRVVGPCTAKAAAVGCDPAWIALWDHEDDDDSGLCHRWAPTTAATLAAVRTLDPDAYEVPVTDVHPPEWPNPAPDGLWQVAIAATVR